MRSDDAGVSFTDMTNENKPTIQDDPAAPESQFAEGMHPDQHALVFSPANAGGTEQVLVGSDGGVVRTSGAFADDSARCDQRQADKPADGKLSPEELALCKQALSAVPTRHRLAQRRPRDDPVPELDREPGPPGHRRHRRHPGQRHLGVHGRRRSGSSRSAATAGQSAIDPAAGTRVHTYFGPTSDVNFNGNDPTTWDYISQPLDEANLECGSGDVHGECFSFYVPMIRDPKAAGTLYTGGEYVWRTQDSGGDREDLDAHCRETAFAIGDGEAICGDWVRLGGAKGHIGTAGNYIVATERAPGDSGTLWVGRRRGGAVRLKQRGRRPIGRVQFTAVARGDLPAAS